MSTSSPVAVGSAGLVRGDTPRERLLQGLAVSLRTRDFAAVTVADIVAAAHTSRRTFYECFETKQQCLIEMVHDVNRQRRDAIAAAVDPAAPAEVQIRQALSGLFEAVDLEPLAFVHSMREIYSLGDAGRALVREDLDTFVDLLLTLVDTPELRARGVRPPSREIAVVLVGGIRELVISTVEVGADVGRLIESAALVAERLLVPGLHDHMS